MSLTEWIAVCAWLLLPGAFFAGRVYENHKAIQAMKAAGAVFKDKRSEKL